MKRLLLLLVVSALFVSCSDDKQQHEPADKITNDNKVEKEAPNFFQVTNFLKGEIAGIQNGGINPQKITTTNQSKDSVWLKMENLPVEMADFLTPVIDSTNLISQFSEEKFFDQTNNTVTLTYDLIHSNDTMKLRHWDVYIDPTTGKVKRIYLLKEFPEKKMKQLTWIAGQSCSIVNIADDLNGKPFVENKVDIKWIF